jgi:alkylation response protein AidB-like acyl-CoA dehydrogenase
MYLDYTPEQQALRDELRTYFARLVTPEYQAELGETEGGGPVYTRTVRPLGADGWLGIGWPKEYGGQGRSAIEQFIFFDEASRAGIMLPTLTINAVAPAIMEHGSAEQKAKYLPAILRGECHFAIGYTEPSSGTDLASLRTRAVRDGDEWVLNGTKMFITQGTVGHVYVVLASTAPEREQRGISAFLVERGMRGLSNGRKIEKLGLRSSDTAEVVLDNVRIPTENLIGGEHEGFRQALAILDRGRIGIAAWCLGIGRAALEESLAYAQERTAFGRPIAELQAIQFMLADMATRLDAARMLTWRAAHLKETGRPFRAEASMAKLMASEAAMSATTKAVQIFGGYGYMRDYPVERLMRDAKVTAIYEGTSEIQRVVIARQLLNRP